jgi:DNA-directed RNA polymerase subunit L
LGKLLVHALQRDSDVEFAGYKASKSKDPHTLQIQVGSKSSDPETLWQRALSSVQSDMDKLDSDFQNELERFRRSKVPKLDIRYDPTDEEVAMENEQKD